MSESSSRKKTAGISIRRLLPSSSFFKAGLRKGDCIVAVNGEPVADELDFRFAAAAPLLRIKFQRNGNRRSISVKRRPGSFIDVEFYQKAIRRCANQCVFCFIDQMPPGLRRRLYIKDEDLFHSFVNGNYVTLTNTSLADLERIARLGLSPLFVSVHATDLVVRSRLLGIKRVPPIMEQLSFLVGNGIRLHTQIVVCPGYNDGAVLTKTVTDLLSLGSSLVSIAVVPVGLTRFRSLRLAPVGSAEARNICSRIAAISDRDRARCGTRRVFLADELFLRACRASPAAGLPIGRPIPPRSYYEDFPQIENGVGLLRQLIDKWNNSKRTARPGRRKAAAALPRRKKYLLVTSSSALPFLEKIAMELEHLRPEISLRVAVVKNRFFGESVTVAGLLTAKDVIRTIRQERRRMPFARVLLPAVMFNYAGFTLDGYGAKRIAKETGVPVTVVESVSELLICR